MTEQEIREAAVNLLKEKGYKVTSTAAGQGVPRLSRLTIVKDGTSKTVAVKVSTGGRISFTRTGDREYKVLSDVDMVLHAKPDPANPETVRLMAFDRETVIDAFEENHKALAAREMAHIPHWINPDPEGGWKVTGSGFGKKALWTANVPTTEAKGSASPAAGGIMDRVKRMLADHMGVDPDELQVDVRLTR